jgi:hypothetical protein
VAAISIGMAVPMAAGLAGASPALPVITPQPFAAGATGQTLPDDITWLDGNVFVTFQNGVPSTGPGPTGPQNSTIVEFDRSGHQVATWSLRGRCDGLTADPARDQVLATVNEDANSYFATISPQNPPPATYTYQPSPEEAGNGGTDSITIGPGGAIYIAHSNPSPTSPDTAALYEANLVGSTAQLTPVFEVDSTATDIVTGKSVQLALTDPDSNRYIPRDDPVFGGSILQDSQGDGQIVIVDHPGTAQQALRLLPLSNAENPGLQPTIDDMVEVTGPGTLYVVDQGADTIQTIDTSTFTPGTIVIAQPNDSGNVGQLGVLNPTTGAITHFSNTFNSPKGLLFIPRNHGQNDQGQDDQGQDDQGQGGQGNQGQQGQA